MNVTQNQHLNDDQIIWTIVDPENMSAFVREHLSACAECQREIERFENDLASLGELAHRLSPRPKNKIALPVGKKALSLFGSWNWKFSFGAVFSAILVVVILWWSGITTPWNPKQTNVSEELFEDEQLMTEISQLSENALPRLYMDITGEVEPETGEEDDFFEFLDPADEDISQS